MISLANTNGADQSRIRTQDPSHPQTSQEGQKPHLHN